MTATAEVFHRISARPSDEVLDLYARAQECLDEAADACEEIALARVQIEMSEAQVLHAEQQAEELYAEAARLTSGDSR